MYVWHTPCSHNFFRIHQHTAFYMRGCSGRKSFFQICLISIWYHFTIFRFLTCTKEFAFSWTESYLFGFQMRFRPLTVSFLLFDAGFRVLNLFVNECVCSCHDDQLIWPSFCGEHAHRQIWRDSLSMTAAGWQDEPIEKWTHRKRFGWWITSKCCTQFFLTCRVAFKKHSDVFTTMSYTHFFDIFYFFWFNDLFLNFPP